MTIGNVVAAPAAVGAAVEPKRLEELQQQRTELVDQYVKARPTGSKGWSTAAGAGLGAVGASIGIGAVMVANRGKGAMYQGFNLMFGMPMALIFGGGIGYAAGSRIGETVTRPTGETATRQVEATRESLQRRISEIDAQLTAADGRRPQPLPAVDDSAKLSLGRVGGHAAAGFGLGMLTTVGALSGAEHLMRQRIKGGPTFLATLAAPAIAGAAISYLDQRDEAAGRHGSLARAAGIGAAVVGASALSPALRPVPLPLRVAGGIAAGALIGTGVHLASVSSRD